MSSSCFSSCFVSLTSVCAKLGLQLVDSDFSTLIRTVVIVVALAAFVAATGKLSNPLALPPSTLGSLVLSALATGASWVCYFRALQLGNASQVAQVAKPTVVLVAVFAFAFLPQRPAPREWLRIALVGRG